MTASKVGSKTKIIFWNRAGKEDPFFHKRFGIEIVDSVEQEREREVLIKLDDFDNCIEKKEDADFSLD